MRRRKKAKIPVKLPEPTKEARKEYKAIIKDPKLLNKYKKNKFLRLAFRIAKRRNEGYPSPKGSPGALGDPSTELDSPLEVSLWNPNFVSSCKPKKAFLTD